MTGFVIDASAIGPLLVPDEAGDLLPGLPEWRAWKRLLCSVLDQWSDKGLSLLHHPIADQLE